MKALSSLMAPATWLVILLLLITGCGHSNGIVDGLVTMDGQPVAQGEITFLPADGVGREWSAPIMAGEFHLHEIPPGDKIVRVTAMEPVPVITSTAELAQQAAAKTKSAPPREIVPANAIGNGQTVTIKAGPQPLQIKLSTPQR